MIGPESCSRGRFFGLSLLVLASRADLDAIFYSFTAEFVLNSRYQVKLT
jgi:hypothetical protein